MKTIFEGIKVIDFTNLFAGPYAAVYFADLGAEVIHIERPQVGDDMRAYTPRLANGPCVSFLVGNRGKKSLCVDITDPTAKEVLFKLIGEADVLIENYRPGVLDRLGYGYDAVSKANPRIVYCSISAFGRTGPYADKGGYDPVTQAISGMMDVTGEPDGLPQKIRSSIADFVGGYSAFAQIAVAMYHRERTGEGNFIDVSMADSYINCNCFVDQVDIGVPEEEMTRCGAHEPRIAPWGHFEAAHGKRIMICAVNDTVWTKLCNSMDRPDLIDDGRFNNAVKRGINQKELIGIIEAFLQSFDSAEDAIAHMDQFGVPCAKINNAVDVANDPHFLERGIVRDMLPSRDVKGVKTFRGRGPFFKFKNGGTVLGVPPTLGEHNEELMRRAGLSEEVIQSLNAKWLPPRKPD